MNLLYFNKELFWELVFKDEDKKSIFDDLKTEALAIF